MVTQQDHTQSAPRGNATGSPDQVRARIEHLIRTQPFGVLCTQGDGQPYGSLVALAGLADLEGLVFATAADTRKYGLLVACPSVAVVVDSRPADPVDLLHGEAATILGHAQEVHRGPEHDRLAALLVARHPRLASFVADPGTALFRVSVDACTFVSRFQNAVYWSPDCDAQG